MKCIHNVTYTFTGEPVQAPTSVSSQGFLSCRHTCYLQVMQFHSAGHLLWLPSLFLPAVNHYRWRLQFTIIKSSCS